MMNQSSSVTARFSGSLPVKFLVPALCLASALTSSAQSTGGNGLWSSTTVNAPWTTGVVPSTTGNPTLTGSHVVTLDANTTVGRFQTSGTAPELATAGFQLTLDSVGGRTWAAPTFTVSGAGSVRNNTAATTVSFSSANTVLNLNGGATLNINLGTASFSTAVAKNINTSGSGALLIGSSGALTWSGGASAATVASGVSFTSTGTINPNTGIFDVKSTTANVSGTMNYNNGGSGVFRYSGAGTMTLGSSFAITETVGSGTDAFQVTSGTLHFNNTSFSNTSDNPIAFSGTGNLTGVASGAGGGSITFASGTSISPGLTAGAIGSLNFNTGTALTFTGTTALTIDVQGGTGGDTITSGAISGLGSVRLTLNNLTGGAWTPAQTGTPNLVRIFDAPAGNLSATPFSNADGSVTYTDGSMVTVSGQQFLFDYTDAGDVDLIAVPEPAHYAGAIGLGLVGFAALRRHRNGRKA